MKIEEQIQILLKKGELLQIEKILSKAECSSVDITVLKCLVEIFHIEVQYDVAYTVFDYSVDLDELVQHFIKTKLYMRRLEFDLPWNKQKEACQYWLETKVSDEELYYILLTNIFLQKKVCGQLKKIFAEVDGEESLHTQYFKTVERKLEKAK